MKRVVFTIVSTVTGLVMLLSFKTHPISTATAATAVVNRPVATPSASASASAGTTSTKTATATSTKTVTGDSVDTRWGPVQVAITVTNGKITAAKAVVYPQSNPKDEEINSYAVPTLNSEAVSSSSASIDMVSGATYTSQGYIGSLQSALDKL
ncbi:MAG: hypothetical protein JWO22_2364 [Frankiales bacterium]|nr:hypothetical protein [Frankiales bacterium]